MAHSIFRVLVFSLLIFISFSTTSVSAQNIRSANFFFSPLPAEVKEGERVTFRIKINSPLQSANAVSGVLSFPANMVRVVSLGKDKSIINLWTEEPKIISNKIIFEGVILNPGFLGTDGTIFNVTLEARKIGKVYLNLSEGAILANDGLGTNILSDLTSASFKIIPAPVYWSEVPVAPTKPIPPAKPEAPAPVETKPEIICEISEETSKVTDKIAPKIEEPGFNISTIDFIFAGGLIFTLFLLILFAKRKQKTQ